MTFFRFLNMSMSFMPSSDSSDKLAILIGGAIFICIGVLLTISEFSVRKACCASTVGYINDIRRDTDSDCHIIFINYVAYSIGGVEYLKKSPIGRHRNKYYVGQETLVFYNPSNPEQCILKIDKSTSLLLNLSCIAFGLLPYFFI